MIDPEIDVLLTKLQYGFRLTAREAAVFRRFVDKKLGLTRHPWTWYVRARGLLLPLWARERWRL